MRAFCLLLLTLLSWSSLTCAVTLDEVESDLSSFDTLRSSYRQTRHVSGLSSPLEASGSLLMTRDNGLAWMQEKPFQVSYVFTDDNFIENSPGGSRKVTKKADKPQLFQVANLFSTIFSGDKKLLKEYFELQFLTQDNALWKIILIPKNSRLKKLFKSVQLQGSQLVEIVTVYEAGGNKTVINFYNMTTGPTLLSDEEKSYFQN
jgi:outer membrane lipoprotein-sorting protein